MQITTIGLDLAKHWFQVHGVDAHGHIVVRRRLWRSGVIAYFRSLEPCLVGMEACATAHHWARELTALGHTVKLMPPAYQALDPLHWLRPGRASTGTSTVGDLLAHNQHHPEPGIATHHPTISLGRLFQLHGLDHWADVL